MIVDITGSLGRDRFKFLTSDQLKSAAESHDSWNVAIAVGRFDPVYGYLKAEYGYQRGWGASGAAQQICQPFIVGSLRCGNAIVGGPSEGIGQVLGGEWRYFLPGRHVAVDPVIQHDFHEDVTGIQVPFYFLSNKVLFVGTVLKLIE